MTKKEKRNQYMRDYYQKNKEKHLALCRKYPKDKKTVINHRYYVNKSNPEIRRRNKLKYRYGLTLLEWERMSEIL